MSDQNKNQDPTQFAKYSAHIRTMQDDISGGTDQISEHDIGSPEKIFIPNVPAMETNLPKKAPSPEEKTQEYKSSPFFSPGESFPSENKPQPFSQEFPSPRAAGILPEKKVDPTHFVPVETLRPSNSPSSKARKIFFIITILLIICTAAFGAYYFFATKQGSLKGETQQSTIPEQEISINPTLEKFSSTNPNYLSMDISGLPAESLQEKIKGVANEISQAGSTETFEFVVTDANNNPVSFSIFCLATKINLNESVLKSVGESFSLYMTAAEGKTHLAIAVSAKDSDAIKQGLLKEEASLPTDLAPLFLGEKPTITRGSFKNGSYGAIATKYLNLDETQSLSVDYAVTADMLYIGTSKNTLRSAIDKHSSESGNSAETSTITPTNQ